MVTLAPSFANSTEEVQNFPTTQQAVLSPDGEKLAFISDVRGHSTLWIANPDGTNARPLFSEKNQTHHADPDWSSDSKFIVYSSGDGPDIYITDADGMTPKQLTKNSGSNTAPRFAHKSNHILFTSSRTGKHELWYMDINGNEQHALGLQGHLLISDPAFSPDDTSVVYTGCQHLPNGGSSQDLQCDLYITPINAKVTKITKEIRMSTATRVTEGYNPDWGKAGIIFTKFQDNGIWMVNPDGTNLQRITKNNDASYDFPRWAKVNGHILSTKTKNDANIWTLDMNGNEKRLTNFLPYE